jgi:hypothetical protein
MHFWQSIKIAFCKHLPTTVNPNSELISFDVVSLYTNIPHDLGISAITFWLENKRNIVQDRFSKEFILETVKIILERNVFYFDGKFYRQKRGTAMGTKMAPTYATLVLFGMKNFNGNVRVPYNKTIIKKTLPVLSYIRCKFLSIAIQKLFV